MHRILFADYGIKPIKLNEGSTFHIGTKCPEGAGYFGYVDDAYKEEYHNIEG